MANRLLNANENCDSNNESLFLSSYDIENYFRPSVATDIVALKMRGEKAESHRKDSATKLSILLIKRGEHPFLNQWALPGGFLRHDETVEECAIREITEETNLTPVSILPLGVFSEIDRDPRGRIISNAFVSIITENENDLIGSFDAIEAKWFDVSYRLCEDGSYTLELSCEDERILCKLKMSHSSLKPYDFQLIENTGLAFDHAKIISTAFEVLRSKVSDPYFAFDFLPEKFTLSSLQKVYETLTGETLLTANFRRKMSEFVAETDEFTEGAGHRPARLFRKKLQ